MASNKEDYPIVIFDFGGVLLDWDPRHLYRKLFDGDEASMERFLAEVGFSEWNHEQDKGRPFAVGIAELSGQFPQHAALISAFGERWEESIAGPIGGSVEILHQLKEKNTRLYGLSNWSVETFYRIRPEHDFLSWFDGIVLSGEVGYAKPDPAIYRILLQEVNEPAHMCMFIDDSEANIVAAAEMGFMAIHFDSPQQLRTELSARGVL
jgi:2-haloacid dehalogenase